MTAALHVYESYRYRYQGRRYLSEAAQRTAGFDRAYGAAAQPPITRPPEIRWAQRRLVDP